MSWVPSSACAPANWKHRINSSQDSNQAKKVGKSVVHRWHCGQETEDYTYIVGNTTCSVKCKIHFQHKISILLSYFIRVSIQVKWIIHNVFESCHKSQENNFSI